MKGYSLPPQLGEEIDQLEALVTKYRRGEASATELKAHRVPFGVYEQREPDTYMMRIRCAAGSISPLRLEKVASLASRYGIKDIHITSRQELQLHYVKLDDMIPLIKNLRDIGLVTRGGGGNTVRNISAQEDAGIDPNEEFDVTPYAVALTTRLIAEDDSWNLPRKFKIAFSGSKEDKGYATLADVGFIAVSKGNEKGFKVYAAGGLGAKSEAGKLILDFIKTDEVYPVAKAVKDIFWKYGNRKNKHAARLRFLWNDLGPDEFKRRFNEEYAKIKEEGFSPLDIEKMTNGSRVSGLAEEAPGDAKEFELWKTRYVRPQKQENLFSVEIPIKLGFITSESALGLARFLLPFGDDCVRMTKNQNFLLRNIPGKYLGNGYNFLKITFQDIDRPAIYGRILSCAGASTCQLGICLSRQVAKALMAELEKSSLNLDGIGDIKLNISGCPNSCGQHPASDIGFFGKALRKDGKLYPAYNVVCASLIEDGRTKLAELIGEIASKDLPRLVTDFIGEYLSKPGRNTTIREYVRGEGKNTLKVLCERYKNIPAFGGDKNYYFDWGSDTVFSMSERRAGECSAGLFDLIEMDRNNIKEAKHDISTARGDDNRKKALLGKLVFYSARMLLITRAIEPQGEAEAYKAFLEHFIETGLVLSSFKEIIKAAERKDYQMLLGKEADVIKLAESVESLYEDMDNSFNFKSSVRNGQETAVKATVLKDLRGVACPMNFVKTKIELSKLKPGERLEVWLDDGEPIENVPGSVKAEGHKIISQKKIDNYWSAVIEKR